MVFVYFRRKIITIPGAYSCEKFHFVSSVAVQNALEQEHQFFSFVSLSACKIKHNCMISDVYMLYASWSKHAALKLLCMSVDSIYDTLH